MAELQLSQHVKWREQYVSSALNKKFSGVTEPGVYFGFELSPGGDMNLQVSPGDDFATSVAVVERDGYSVTIQAPDAGLVAVPSTGTFYVCLEAFYVPNDSGYQQIVFRAVPEDHHVVLGKINVPAGTTSITTDMISEEGRQVGNPSIWLIELLTKYVETQADVLDQGARLTNLENWAKTQGYDPTVAYSGS
jgi:hypothetical protein